MLACSRSAQTRPSEWTFWSLSAGQNGLLIHVARKKEVGSGRFGSVGLGRLEGRIPYLHGRGARLGSGLKSFWPTCEAEVGPSEEDLNVCDPEFDRKV